MPRTPRSARHASRGFTLIELLIVIGIITILAALLFPALTRVREQARIAQCSSQEKQLALGWQRYPSDNRRWLMCANAVRLPPCPPAERQGMSLEERASARPSGG